MMMQTFDPALLPRSITNSRAPRSCSDSHEHGNGHDHGNGNGHNQRHSHSHGPFATSFYFPVRVPTTPATAANKASNNSKQPSSPTLLLLRYQATWRTCPAWLRRRRCGSARPREIAPPSRTLPPCSACEVKLHQYRKKATKKARRFTSLTSLVSSAVHSRFA